MRSFSFFVCLLLVSASFAQNPAKSSPEVLITSLNIQDTAGKLPSSDLEQIIAEVQRHSYAPSSLQAEVTERVRYEYQRYGFFDVKVSPGTIRIVKPGMPRETAEVAMSVEAGHSIG